MSRLADDRLDSWKAIAAYLDRGVRTVRRWERTEGLPVHRQMHRRLGSVYGYRSEIEGWRRSRGARPVLPIAGGRRSVNDPPSIVVLPFAHLSGNPDTEYIADGLTAEVIGDLSKVHRLRVISRTSSMTLKGSSKTVRTLARELGVRYVIEGSVHEEAGRLRVRAQLIDAATDTHVWSEKHEGVVTDVATIQERLARATIDALEITLTAAEDRRLGERPIADVQAYECYLRARYQSWRWRKDAIDEAVRLLESGLTIVGPNARLDAALGLTHLQYREAGIEFGDGPLLAAEACAQRLDTLPGDPVWGLLLRGWIDYARARIQSAVRHLNAALEIEAANPDALLLLCNCYLISGQIAAARPLVQRSLTLDPLSPLPHCLPGWADLLEGHLAAAVEPYRRMFEMDPGNPMGRLFYVYVLALNDRADALPSLVDGFSADVRDTVPSRLAAFLADARSSRADAARWLTPQVEQAARTIDTFARFLAHGFGWLGQFDAALDWLKVAVDRGFINYPFMAEHDPVFARFRTRPAFQSLLERIRAEWEHFEC